MEASSASLVSSKSLCSSGEDGGQKHTRDVAQRVRVSECGEECWRCEERTSKKGT